MMAAHEALSSMTYLADVARPPATRFASTRLVKLRHDSLDIAMHLTGTRRTTEIKNDLLFKTVYLFI